MPLLKARYDIMKKFIAVLLLTVMLAVSVAALANVEFTKDCYAYKHVGYDKTSTIIKKGSVAKVDHWNSAKSWVKVFLNSKTKRWVRGKYVKTAASSKPVKIMYAGGGSSYSTTGSTTTLTGYSKVKATGKCNIRATACLQGKILGIFQKGKSMTFTGKVSTDSRGIDWYSVVTPTSAKGWVSSVYTVLVK